MHRILHTLLLANTFYKFMENISNLEKNISKARV